MANKPPTIYLPLEDGELGTVEDSDSGLMSIAYLDEYAARTSHQHIAVYEPAVPRCKTCPYWSPGFQRRGERFPSRCRASGNWLRHDDDGSGYCSKHPEARR